MTKPLPPRPEAPDDQALVDALAGQYVVVAPDVQLTVIAVSEAYARLVRSRPEAIMGRGLLEVLAEDLQDRGASVADSIARAIELRAPDEMPPERREDDGEERWLRVINAPVLGADGAVRSVIHRVEDVTSCARRSDAGMEARANAVAQIGIWWFDVENDTRRWSDELYRIFGVARGTALSWERLLECVHPDDRAQLARLLPEAKGGATIDSQYRIVVRGETRWVRARTEVQPGPGGIRVGTVQDITDLKRAEEDLAREEALLRSLFEGTPDGVFVADGDGNYIDVNPAACRLLGYSRDELLTMNVRQLVAPNELPRQTSLVDRLRGGALDVSEWRLKKKDGTWLPVELSANALPDGRLQGLVRDITERRQAEDRLRLSEEKYSGIVSMSVDAVISIDEDQRITLFNQGAEAIFGWAQREILGQPIDVLIPGALRALHREHIDAFARGPAASKRMGDRNTPIAGRRKDGEEFPADAAISKIDVGGRRVLTVVLRDATEQRRVELEERFLSEVGAVLANTLDFDDTVASIVRLALDLGDWSLLVALDDDGGIRRTAVSAADPARQPAADALRSLPIGRGQPHLGREALSSGRPHITVCRTAEQVRDMFPDDERRRIIEALGLASVMEVPLFAHGRLVGALVVVSASRVRRYAATELHLLDGLGQRAALALENARLYHAGKVALEDRDSVLGIVAHDLRNPLNAILLATQVQAMRGAAGGGRSGETIKHAAERMNRLIQDLLDVRRAAAGGLSLSRERVAPRAACEAAASAQRQLAEEAGVELAVVAPAALPDAWGDAGRLSQVFDNLLGNALKFTPRGGRVTLSAAQEGDHLLFLVVDTGPGIPEEVLPHVFDRFWQAKNADRAGAGLGLAIAKGVVEAHGGRIFVDSVPGRGATFGFTIPIAPRSSSTTGAEPPLSGR